MVLHYSQNVYEMMLILFSTRALDKQATHSFNPVRLLSDNCTNTGVHTEGKKKGTVKEAQGK